MNILLSTVIEVGQVPNNPASHWLWIIGSVVAIAGIISLMTGEDGCFGALFIIGGIIAIIVFFCTPLGTHLGSPIQKIEEQYSITILNEEALVQSIEEADDLSPVELSYKANGELYQEEVLVLKEEDRSRSDLKSYSFEIFSSSQDSKVKAVPFESCNVELCPGGVRKFN